MSNLMDNANKIVDMTYKPVEESLYSGNFIRSLTQVDNSLIKPMTTSVDYSKMDNLSDTQKTLLNNISQANTQQVNLATADLNNMFKSTLNKIAVNSQDTVIQMGMNVNSGNDINIDQSGRNISYLQDVNTVAQNQIIEQQRAYTTEAGKILAQAAQANNQLLGQAVQLQDSTEKFNYQKEQAAQQFAFGKEQYYTSLLGTLANDKGQAFDPKTGKPTDKPIYTIQGDQYYNYTKPLQNFTLFQKSLDAKFYQTEKQSAINTSNLNNRIAATNEKIAISNANREDIKFQNALKSAEQANNGGSSSGGVSNSVSATAKALTLSEEASNILPTYIKDGKFDEQALMSAYTDRDENATKLLKELDTKFGVGRGIYYDIDVTKQEMTKDSITGLTIPDTSKPPKIVLRDPNSLLASMKEKIKTFGLNLNAKVPDVSDIVGNEKNQIGITMQEAFSNLLESSDSVSALNKVMLSSNDNKQIILAVKNVNGEVDGDGNLLSTSNSNDARYAYFKFDLNSVSEQDGIRLKEDIERLKSTEDTGSKLNDIVNVLKKSAGTVKKYKDDNTGTLAITDVVNDIKNNQKNWNKSGVFGGEGDPAFALAFIASQSLSFGSAGKSSAFKYDKNQALPNSINSNDSNSIHNAYKGLINTLNENSNEQLKYLNNIDLDYFSSKPNMDDVKESKNKLVQNRLAFESLLQSKGYYKEVINSFGFANSIKDKDSSLAKMQTLHSLIRSGNNQLANDDNAVADMVTILVNRSLNSKLTFGDKKLNYSEWYRQRKGQVIDKNPIERLQVIPEKSEFISGLPT